MFSKKSAARVLRRGLLAFTAVFALLLLLLLAKPLFAPALELSGYTAAEAEKYRALPLSGPNFKAASHIAHGIGRYYLKGKSVAAIVAAYGELAEKHPQYHYLYGEMGWKGGGRFRPHRTHQQGLSADFMTPMIKIIDGGKKTNANLPCNAFNLWGYDIRLDSRGQYENYQIDARAMIAHLAALKKAAPHYGLRIRQVIFDPPLLKILRADPNFPQLRGLRFMAQKAWFPHDSHYHVDFAAE